MVAAAECVCVKSYNMYQRGGKPKEIEEVRSVYVIKSPRTKEVGCAEGKSRRRGIREPIRLEALLPAGECWAIGAKLKKQREKTPSG